MNPISTIGRRTAPLCGIALLLSGCASYYNAPGSAADMAVFGVGGAEQAGMTDPTIAARMDVRPAASLPTVLAVARVQGPGYRSYGADGYGEGRYSIVTSLDAEKPEDLDRLRKLSLVREVVLINRLTAPTKLNTDRDLRGAAGALHADMTLVYTFDTTFRTDDHATPLTLVTLGLFPGQVASVSTTASGVLLDTRTGYIYATASGDSKQTQLANAWTSTEAADDARIRAEREALDEMLTSFEQSWRRVVLDSPNWSRQPRPERTDSGWRPVGEVVRWMTAGEPVPAGNQYRTVPKQ